MSLKWFGDPAFDSTGLWVLAQANIWNPGAHHLLEEYAKRARIDDAAWALNQLIRKFPAKAAPRHGALKSRYGRRFADQGAFDIAGKRQRIVPIPSAAIFACRIIPPSRGKC